MHFRAIRQHMKQDVQKKLLFLIQNSFITKTVHKLRANRKGSCGNINYNILTNYTVSIFVFYIHVSTLDPLVSDKDTLPDSWQSLHKWSNWLGSLTDRNIKHVKCHMILAAILGLAKLINLGLNIQLSISQKLYNLGNSFWCQITQQYFLYQQDILL